MSPLLTVAEAAEYLAVSKVTVYRLVREQGLPAVKVTADIRFRLSDIERWLDGRVAT